MRMILNNKFGIGMNEIPGTITTFKMASNPKPKSVSASATIDVLMEISRLLNTGLDEETMAICLRLCENGINPEALAEVIRELRRESAIIKAAEFGDSSVDMEKR